MINLEIFSCALIFIFSSVKKWQCNLPWCLTSLVFFYWNMISFISCWYPFQDKFRQNCNPETWSYFLFQGHSATLELLSKSPNIRQNSSDVQTLAERTIYCATVDKQDELLHVSPFQTFTIAIKTRFQQSGQLLVHLQSLLSCSKMY